MKILPQLFLFIFFVFNATAQAGKVVTFNPTKDNEEDFWKTVLQYPQFEPGKAFFKNGGEAQAKFNYSYLSNNILFIDPKGDTLELVHPENFDKIIIRTDTFYNHDKEFVQQISHGPSYNLFLKRSLNFNGAEKKSAYNGYSSTQSSESRSSFSDGYMMHYLSVDENSIYMFQDTYFVMDRFDKVFSATKKGFCDLFWKNEQQIKTFIADNKTNFEKKEDIEKLLQYARKLTGNSPTQER